MIEVANLTRYYGDFAALEDVSFSVQQGEIIGLLGLNGAGKTTTLEVLAGLLAPSAGKVTFDGIDVAQAPEALRGQIGYLPEDPPQYRDMTVGAFLRYVGQLKGMGADRVERQLPEVMATAQLEGREDQVIGTLSHGYRKRVGIAQTLIHDPKLVILDEPISGLDPVQIVSMRKVIRNLGQGRSVLISSHILSEISQTADRILVLHQGRLVAQGAEEDLRSRLGGVRLHITVRGEAEAFERWLQDSPRVEAVRQTSAEPPFVRALVELVEDDREALLAEIQQAGFGLRLVEMPQDELEEIFLGLTEGQAS